MKKTKNFYSIFNEKLELLRSEVKKVPKAKFIAYLIGLFMFPGGSILCLVALYLRIFKTHK
ncbi:MAG: hypothetical protein CBC76_02785 [Flavobacteriaceae bacterium TMED116]|nr:MAG: hypothetical protein CBC76_02785 [Flavobacteriaceae bacterium TMED116]